MLASKSYSSVFDLICNGNNSQNNNVSHLDIITWNLLAPSLSNPNIETNVEYLQGRMHRIQTFIKTRIIEDKYDFDFMNFTEVDEYTDYNLSRADPSNSADPVNRLIDYKKRTLSDTILYKDIYFTDPVFQKNYNYIYCPKPYTVGYKLNTSHGNLMLIHKDYEIIKVYNLCDTVSGYNLYNNANVNSPNIKVPNNDSNQVATLVEVRGKTSRRNAHVVLVSVHLAASDGRTAERLLQIERILKHLKTFIHHNRIILLGDFNQNNMHTSPIESFNSHGYEVLHLDSEYPPSTHSMLDNLSKSKSSKDSKDDLLDYIVVNKSLNIKIDKAYLFKHETIPTEQVPYVTKVLVPWGYV